jgi:hypothetical protein
VVAALFMYHTVDTLPRVLYGGSAHLAVAGAWVQCCSAACCSCCGVAI